MVIYRLRIKTKTTNVVEVKEKKVEGISRYCYVPPLHTLSALNTFQATGTQVTDTQQGRAREVA